MPIVKILGAGSAGNHFAHAFRRKGWDVVLTDNDADALERTRSTTYPQRYGQWDSAIRLALSSAGDIGATDVTVIATPPDSHSRLALEELKAASAKIILIEKPLAQPNDPLLKELLQAAESSAAKVLVGYNHNLSPSVQVIADWITSGRIGAVHSINVDVRENSQFILNAHPWLAGVTASYLGSLEHGGGAAFEHSHGVALWLHLAHFAGIMPLVKVHGHHRFSGDRRFDQAACYLFENAKGICGSVNQDFLSSPPLKRAEIFGDKGRITWTNVFKANHEEVLIASENESARHTFPKQRETDFVNEVEHIEKLLRGEVQDSTISLQRGLEAFEVLNTGLNGN